MTHVDFSTSEILLQYTMVSLFIYKSRYTNLWWGTGGWLEASSVDDSGGGDLDFLFFVSLFMMPSRTTSFSRLSFWTQTTTL